MALVGEPDHFGGGSYAPSDLEQLRAEEIDQLAALPSPIVVEGAKLFSPSKTSRPENRKFVLFAVDPLIMACIDYDRKIDSIQRALANSQKLADEASLKPVALDLKDFRRLRGRGQSLFDYQSTIDNVKSADSPLLPTGGLGSGLGSSADSCSSVEREELCRDMMLRTVTTLTCFFGFQLSSSSVLEVLSDAAIGHLRRLCVHLRKARDHELLVGQHGFADCLDRTLTDCGCEGISGVLNHYHRSVVSRCSALLEEHRKLCNEYTERSLDTDDNSAVEERVVASVGDNAALTQRLSQRMDDVKDRWDCLLQIIDACSRRLRRTGLSAPAPCVAGSSETPAGAKRRRLDDVADSPAPLLAAIDELSQWSLICRQRVLAGHGDGMEVGGQEDDQWQQRRLDTVQSVLDEVESRRDEIGAVSRAGARLATRLLEDILSETSSAAIGLQNLTASGTIDMSHFPNLSFVSAEDEHVKREAPVSSNVPDGVVLKQEQMFPDT